MITHSLRLATLNNFGAAPLWINSINTAPRGTILMIGWISGHYSLAFRHPYNGLGFYAYPVLLTAAKLDLLS